MSVGRAAAIPWRLHGGVWSLGLAVGPGRARGMLRRHGMLRRRSRQRPWAALWRRSVARACCMGPTVAVGCSGGVGRSGTTRTSGRDRGHPLAAPRRHSVVWACCGGQAAPAGCSGAARASGRGGGAHPGDPGAQAVPVMAGPATAITRPHRSATPPPGRATGAAWRTRPSLRLLAPPAASAKALVARAASVTAPVARAASVAAPWTRAVQRPRCGAAPVLGCAAEATPRLRPAYGPARSLAAAAALRERPRGRARSSSRPRPRPPWRPWKSRPAKGWRKRAAKSGAKGQHLGGGGGRQRAEAPEERGS